MAATPVALPLCPEVLRPQHVTVPFGRRCAHECAPPALMATTPVRLPLTATGVDVLVVVPLPSWPTGLAPQHLTMPIGRSCAHECAPPALMAATSVRPPPTATGVDVLVVVPLPS